MGSSSASSNGGRCIRSSCNCGAQNRTRQMAAEFADRHESLEAQTGEQEEQAAARSRRCRRRPVCRRSCTSAAPSCWRSSLAPAPRDSAAVLAATKRRSASRKTMSSLDKRISNEQQLASTYGQWISVVAAQQRVEVNRGLRGVLVILASRSSHFLWMV